MFQLQGVQKPKFLFCHRHGTQQRRREPLGTNVGGKPLLGSSCDFCHGNKNGGSPVSSSIEIAFALVEQWKRWDPRREMTRLLFLLTAAQREFKKILARWGQEGEGQETLAVPALQCK